MLSTFEFWAGLGIGIAIGGITVAVFVWIACSSFCKKGEKK